MYYLPPKQLTRVLWDIQPAAHPSQNQHTSLNFIDRSKNIERLRELFGDENINANSQAIHVLREIKLWREQLIKKILSSNDRDHRLSLSSEYNSIEDTTASRPSQTAEYDCILSYTAAQLDRECDPGLNADCIIEKFKVREQLRFNMLMTCKCMWGQEVSGEKCAESTSDTT